MFFFYCILYYINTVSKETQKALNSGIRLYKVLHGAWLGPNARFRRPARSTVKATEHARAPSQRSDVKGKVAGSRPQLALSSPSRREHPDRSLPSFLAGPAKQMPLLWLAFSLRRQAGPVGSFLWGAGVSRPLKKSPRRQGAPLGPPLRRAGEEGDPLPRGTKKECANRMWNDLGNSGPL